MATACTGDVHGAHTSRNRTSPWNFQLAARPSRLREPVGARGVGCARPSESVSTPRGSRAGLRPGVDGCAIAREATAASASISGGRPGLCSRACALRRAREASSVERAHGGGARADVRSSRVRRVSPLADSRASERRRVACARPPRRGADRQSGLHERRARRESWGLCCLDLVGCAGAQPRGERGAARAGGRRLGRGYIEVTQAADPFVGSRTPVVRGRGYTVFARGLGLLRAASAARSRLSEGHG